ncbi:unnamed protein product [Sphagnum balticum]
MEGQVEIARGQQDKYRRNSESVAKELADMKEKEKSARKGLKIKEQELLTLEGETAGIRQKLKSIDQIYKLETDRVKDENEKLRTQL